MIEVMDKAKRLGTLDSVFCEKRVLVATAFFPRLFAVRLYIILYLNLHINICPACSQPLATVISH